MYQHLDCIALRTVKVSDSKNILSAWTRTFGRLSFSIPSGAGREARRRRAICGPLAAFEAECDVRPGRDIHSLRDVRACASSLSLASSPAKSVVAIFLSEVLDLLLRRSEPDEALSDFLFGSAEAFAAISDNSLTASFHIIFLYHLTHYAGIEPDMSGYAPGTVFDLREGVFRATHPLHPDFLTADEAALFASLPAARYDAPLGIDHTARRRLLNAILKYYGLHLMSLSSLKSLEILRDMA